MVATCLPTYYIHIYIYKTQHAFLLQVAVNTDKAARHLSNISSKTCARACIGAVGMLKPFPSHMFVHGDQQSMPIDFYVRMLFFEPNFSQEAADF